MTKTVSVTRAGVGRVACLDDLNLREKSEYMVELIEKVVQKERPKMDGECYFAARITITVKLLDDLEEREEK